jgi:hypothetical protein
MSTARFPRVGSEHTLDLVLLDQMSENTEGLQSARVRVIQPHGCPRNGTMGMGYVELLDGTFVGLVCRGSLT